MPGKVPKKYKTDVKPPSPKWDLYRDGLSQTLICKFIEDRERFRLYTVEGFRDRGIKRARDYGTIFHKIRELHAKQHDILGELSKWIQAKFQGSAEDMVATQLDAKIALIQFEIYIKTFAKHKYKYIDAEKEFRIQYELPSGAIIPLRGRIDRLISKGRGIWVEDDKTKQRIDMIFIEDTLRSNIQMMLYALGVERVYRRPVTGIVYNVIRQPGLRQTGKDKTEADFLARVRDDISKRPEHYFQRRILELEPHNHAEWRTKTLDPLLEHIVLWWESIKHNPFDPWHLPSGRVNPHHWLRPFGVYSPMSQGRGDYYEYIIHGDLRRINIVDTAFEELDDDEESEPE